MNTVAERLLQVQSFATKGKLRKIRLRYDAVFPTTKALPHRALSSPSSPIFLWEKKSRHRRLYE